MRLTSQNGKKRPPAAAQHTTAASLSIVVVGAGSEAVTQQVAQVLVDEAAGAQLILVLRREPDSSFASRLRGWGAEYVVAPEGCSRAEMCDLGMHRATGSIVAVRDDREVGDGRWVRAYDHLVSPSPVGRAGLAVAEKVVMDSLASRQEQPVDVAPVVFRLEGAPSAMASIEMAATM